MESDLVALIPETVAKDGCYVADKTGIEKVPSTDKLEDCKGCMRNTNRSRNMVATPQVWPLELPGDLGISIIWFLRLGNLIYTFPS